MANHATQGGSDILQAANAACLFRQPSTFSLRLFAYLSFENESLYPPIWDPRLNGRKAIPALRMAMTTEANHSPRTAPPLSKQEQGDAPTEVFHHLTNRLLLAARRFARDAPMGCTP
jgi:hypothetical protein